MDMRRYSTWGGRGGWLFNFVARDRLVNLRINLACPVGEFSVWTGLQGTEGVGGAISAYDSDMAALGGQNSQADHILRAAHVV